MSRKYWSDEDVCQLIELYSKYFNLWNTGDPQFTNRTLRDTQVNSFIPLLGNKFTAKEIKDKWRNLRIQYFSEIKKQQIKVEDCNGIVDSYQSKWKFFPFLSFLSNTTTPENMLNNFEIQLANCSDESITPISPISSENSFDIQHNGKRKRVNEILADLVESKVIETLASSISHHMDEIDLHFKSLAMRVKKMKSQKLMDRAMIECLQIVTRLQSEESKNS